MKSTVFALCFAFAATSASAEQLGLASGQQGSQNFAANAAIAKLLSEEAGFDVQVEAYGGTGQYLPLINEGEIDLAAVVDPDAGPAYNGTGPFEGNAMENLRLLARLSPSRVGIMVAADSDIETLEDLRGKRVTYGMTAQPTLAPMVDAILANGGLTADDVVQVLVASVRRGADEFLSGNADAVFFALRAGKMREVDSQVGGIRWLSLSDSPEAIARMREHVGTSYIIREEPSDAQVGISEPTNVMGFDYVLVSSTNIDTGVADTVIRALYDNPDALRSARPLAEFDPDKMADEINGLVYLDAAVETYRDLGLLPTGK